MIRIFILTLTLLVAAACQEKADLERDARNPLYDCVVSQTARAGKEAVVQWNGFGPGPELFLRAADGSESPVEVSTVTSSGLIFRVPSGFAGGVYTLLYKVQDGMKELGQIEILAAEMPVTGLKFPSTVESGKDFLMEGLGFVEGFVVILENGTSRIPLDCSLESDALRVVLPSGLSGGEYSLYLSDGDNKWLLSESFTVSLRKRLSSISMETPVFGSLSYRVKYEIETEADQVKAIVFISEQLSGGEVAAEEAHDRYVLHPDGVFRVEGGECISNNFDFGYSYDSDGRPESAEVRRYSRTNPEGSMSTYTYEYNPDGTPSTLSYMHSGVKRSMQMWFYEDGNIVEMKASTTFAYEDESLKNHPFASDFAMAYAALSDTMEPFIYAPYLIGRHPFVSRLLPSSLYIDPGSGVKNKVDLTYTFDSDGYMVKAEMKSTSTTIEFEYI